MFQREITFKDETLAWFELKSKDSVEQVYHSACHTNSFLLRERALPTTGLWKPPWVAMNSFLTKLCDWTRVVLPLTNPVTGQCTMRWLGMKKLPKQAKWWLAGSNALTQEFERGHLRRDQLVGFRREYKLKRTTRRGLVSYKFSSL